MGAVVQEQDVRDAGLPVCVQDALGELVSDARQGLLALSVGVGLGVLHELLALEVEAIVGPKGRHDRDRVAVRHGYEHGSVTLGGRRVPVRRRRARTVDGEREIELATYAYFASRDPLSKVILEQLLARVFTRRFERTREPVGERVLERERSVSKSAVSRAFVSRTRDQLKALMSRDLSDLRIAVLMIDGIDLKGRTNVVALGITTEGEKLALGLWEGSTENATVAQSLVSDLVDRGLDIQQGVLVVIDGAKALRKAVRCSRSSATHADVDQPLRINDRMHPPHLRQRQTLAERRHGAALDRRRDARSRTQLQTHPRSRRPRRTRDRSRTRHHPPHHNRHTTDPLDPNQTDRYARDQLTPVPDRHHHQNPRRSGQPLGRASDATLCIGGRHRRWARPRTPEIATSCP